MTSADEVRRGYEHAVDTAGRVRLWLEPGPRGWVTARPRTLTGAPALGAAASGEGAVLAFWQASFSLRGYVAPGDAEVERALVDAARVRLDFCVRHLGKERAALERAFFVRLMTDACGAPPAFFVNPLSQEYP